MNLILLRIKNELYFWLYFYWARLLFPYKSPNVKEFNKYHLKYWELCPPRAYNQLLDYDEIFISPCVFNPINCGGVYNGKYLSKTGLIHLENGKDD